MSGLQQAARDAIASVLPTGPARPPRSSHSMRVRRRARDGRRRELPPEPVQPRDPGRAPARLRVQAVRTCDRAAGEHLAVEHAHVVEAGDDQRGRPVWVVNDYEGEALGPIDLTKAIAVSDNSVFSQLTALVGTAEGRADRHATSESRRRSRVTSRSASAPSRRHRSRWRAPTPPSPTAASASTARSSATRRVRSSRSRRAATWTSTGPSTSPCSAPTQADVGQPAAARRRPGRNGHRRGPAGA